MQCSLLRRGYRILAVGDPVIMLMTKNIWVGLPPKYLFLSESSSKGGERLSKINFQCLLFNVVSAQSMTTPTLSTQSMVLLTPFLRRHNFHIVDDYAYAVFTQSDYYADIMSTQSHTTLASFPLTRNLKKIELFCFFYICSLSYKNCCFDSADKQFSQISLGNRTFLQNRFSLSIRDPGRIYFAKLRIENLVILCL